MSDESRVRVAVTVTGIVQGVGFRWWTERIARSLGISGMVWNKRDGSVGIEAQGEEPSVKLFIDAISRGPAGSLVRGVVTRAVSCVEDSGSFSVTFAGEES